MKFKGNVDKNLQLLKYFQIDITLRICILICTVALVLKPYLINNFWIFMKVQFSRNNPDNMKIFLCVSLLMEKGIDTKFYRSSIYYWCLLKTKPLYIYNSFFVCLDVLIISFFFKLYNYTMHYRFRVYCLIENIHSTYLENGILNRTTQSVIFV